MTVIPSDIVDWTPEETNIVNRDLEEGDSNMSELFQKFAALKKKVGGNRELYGYEESFGMPREEQQHITPPARYLVRILSELEFALRLSAELEHRFDALVCEVLDELSAKMEEDGVLTRSVCAEAEEKLLPMKDDAKAYKLILAGHAHIDMNWMWSWTETVAATVATFTTMLNIMDEYPEFCFSQSQTAVYQIIDEYAPELHDRIKARIDEGRWEVTSSAWVETDKNMPNTESLLRHIEYSKKYLGEKWGIPAEKLEVDFSPDTFGHSANLPELDGFGGVKYYYHCRALYEDRALYRWRAPSGREMIGYREQYWYNSGINPKPAMTIFDVARRSGGLKTALVVYGVGDHGGGPTRRDVERGLEMKEWPIFPTVKFGTVAEYFHEAETVRDKLPLVDHELNCIFEGCYTTQSRIKRGNRRSENALSEAETFSALAHLAVGAPTRPSAFEKAWQKVLFTHFHDILTGSCVQDSREHAMGLYQDALATANTETSLSLSKLAAAIDTSGITVIPDPNSQSEGAGAGYNIENFSGRAADERGQGLTRIWNVFNSTAADRDEPVEITVWDWTGDMRTISVTDAEGNPLEYQKLDHSLQQYWDHKYFRFLVKLCVPALSYTTVVLTEGTMEEYPAYRQPVSHGGREDRNYVLDNGLVRAEFDGATGEMISFKDLETDTELLSRPARPVLIDTNRRNSSAWNIGTYLAVFPITDVNAIHGTAGGSLRSGFTYDASIRSSKVAVEYTLDKGAKAVKAKLRVDWSEVGGDKVPVLAYEFPTSVQTDQFRYNIPGGTLIRPAAHADRPGLSYAAAWKADAKELAAVITDSKYGFRCTADDGHAKILSTLINTSTNPDPYPERGIHEITLTLGLLPACPVAAENAAVAANRPMVPCSTGSHKGTLPSAGTLLDAKADTGVLSAVIAEGDSLTVRFYSVSDEPGTITVCAKRPVKSACLTDLMGTPIGEAAADGETVTAPLAPRSVAQVKIGF